MTNFGIVMPFEISGLTHANGSNKPASPCCRHRSSGSDSGRVENARRARWTNIGGAAGADRQWRYRYRDGGSLQRPGSGRRRHRDQSVDTVAAAFYWHIKCPATDHFRPAGRRAPGPDYAHSLAGFVYRLRLRPDNDTAADQCRTGAALAAIGAEHRRDHPGLSAWFLLGHTRVAAHGVATRANRRSGHTRVIMAFALLSALVNLPLNYIFIYGKLGVPAMGGVGCGWATALANTIAAVALLTYLHKSRHYQRFHLLAQWTPPRWRDIGALLQLGVPIGITIFVEVSMFSSSEARR